MRLECRKKIGSHKIKGYNSADLKELKIEFKQTKKQIKKTRRATPGESFDTRTDVNFLWREPTRAIRVQPEPTPPVISFQLKRPRIQNV